IIPPDDFAMPNGIFLSPDGATLYINNTYDNESFWNVTSDKGNWIWAYDVNADGTVKNPRKFARLFLTPEVVDRKGKTSAADGMTIDENGGIYVATYMGVQVFDPQGRFLGIVNTPTYPVSCCFGGDDMKTLFMVSYDKIYRIRTNVKGLKYGPK
ncbi:MAG: SMP-30/gluconolactonase/LRE family protein, partial [Candidatus Aminicenantales bacterium]